MMNRPTQSDADKERIRQDWQRRFGWLPVEQREHWLKPCVSLSTYIVKAETDAIHYNEMARKSGRGEGSASYDCLYLLFATGIRTAKEIAALIADGHPEGATARWRTLHETAVVMTVIRRSEPAIGERFKDHAIIQAFKMLASVRKLAERPGALHAGTARARRAHGDRGHRYDPFEEMPAADFRAVPREAEAKHREMIEKHGKDFGTQYGWASPLTAPGRRPRLEDLEKLVGMDAFRLLYTNASHGIHSGSASLWWQSDLSDNEPFGRIIGPDANGSSVPGSLTSITLMQLRTEWRTANETRNRLHGPGHYARDIARITDEGADLARSFADCETDPAYRRYTEWLSESLARSWSSRPTSHRASYGAPLDPRREARRLPTHRQRARSGFPSGNAGSPGQSEQAQRSNGFHA